MVTLQTHHVYSTLKRCGNSRFHVVSARNTSGAFVGKQPSKRFISNFIATLQEDLPTDFNRIFSLRHLDQYYLNSIECFL